LAGGSNPSAATKFFKQLELSLLQRFPPIVLKSFRL